MKLLKICLLTLVFTNTVFSQNIDSLFQEFLQSRGTVNTPALATMSTETGKPGKCGFSAIGQLVSRADELSAAKRAQLQIMLNRPERDTSFVSPGGMFRIHYDFSGPYEPAYDMDDLALAFDSSYNYEVNKLGYPPHLSEEMGGSDIYDVYVGGTSDYGETVFEDQVSPNLYSSYIKIHHEFGVDFPQTSRGIDGARVTAAHEYHHAIQLANYGYFSSEIFFYELTSTSMEEFVFDDVNDYYNYLPRYFRMTDRAFADWGSDGYRLVLWNLYLREKFALEGEPDRGFEVIKRSWELLPNLRMALPSIGQALLEYGASFKQEFSNYGTWCYFTDYRADPVNYFEEGSMYPKVSPIETYDYEPPREEYYLNSEPVSQNYLVFSLVQSEFNDTLVSVITNHDIENGKSVPYTPTDYTYILLTGSEPGSSQIVNEYYSKIESENVQILNESNVFNNEEVSGETVEREEVDYAFPQPFKYSTDYNIFIPVKNNDLGYAGLKVYTSGMDLVYEGQKNILASDKIVVQWDARDTNGDKLPTGVYIYATDSDDNIITGKLIIYND